MILSRLTCMKDSLMSPRASESRVRSVIKSVLTEPVILHPPVIDHAMFANLARDSTAVAISLPDVVCP